ncbi:MAG: tetratricopeptide repeat protein [Pseudomonadota bacterium]
MTKKRNRLNRAVAALLISAVSGVAFPAFAQGADTAEVDRLLEELAKPEQPGWEQIEDQIAREWSKSGSPAMDLLLQRARDAMEDDDNETAIGHLTALTDHAPEFAEGWHTRATAYFRAGYYGLALDDIRQALLLEPRHFGAMIGLATILREFGDRERALEVLRMAQEIHPHRPNVNDGIEELSVMLEGEAL